MDFYIYIVVLNTSVTALHCSYVYRLYVFWSDYNQLKQLFPQFTEKKQYVWFSVKIVNII
jgi:hypothetical protein